jgi:acetone carboxylase gamma subunit
MCGETMRLRVHEATQTVPGTPQTNTIRIREWVCPECDYFEDAED